MARSYRTASTFTPRANIRTRAHCRLPAEQGALIVKAVEMAMDKDFVGAAHGQGVEELVGAASSRDRAGTALPQEHRGSQPIAARRADALADIAETYMNNSEPSGSTADRYQVVVHVYPEGTQTAETSHIDDGPHVTAETSRRISYDCSVVGIKEDENGE
jgi:hypothetical protein